MVQTRGQAASAALDHPQVIDLTTEITEIELKTEATKLEALTPFEKFLTGRLHAEDLKPAAEVNQSNDTEVIVAPDNEGPTTRNKNYRSSTNQAAYDAGAGLREQRRQKREQRRQKREQQQQGKAESQRRRELDREARELEADERERLADESRRAQLALQDRKERLKEKLMADRAANIARKEERRIAAAAEQEVARLRKEENQKAHEAKEAERQAKKAEKKRVKAAEQEALTLKYQERKRARQAEHETRYPLTKKPKPDPDQANGSTQVFNAIHMVGNLLANIYRAPCRAPASAPNRSPICTAAGQRCEAATADTKRGTTCQCRRHQSGRLVAGGAQDQKFESCLYSACRGRREHPWMTIQRPPGLDEGMSGPRNTAQDTSHG